MLALSAVVLEMKRGVRAESGREFILDERGSGKCQSHPDGASTAATSTGIGTVCCGGVGSWRERIVNDERLMSSDLLPKLSRLFLLFLAFSSCFQLGLVRSYPTKTVTQL